MRQFPFQFSFDVVAERLDEFVSVMMAHCNPPALLRIEYPVFMMGYEALKRATAEFVNFTPQTVLPVVQSTPITLIVLRAMLGFTPPEWAYMATQRTGVQVPQGAVRSIDRRIRIAPLTPLSKGEVTQQRTTALVEVACLLLSEGAPATPPDRIHRLDKADTKGGLADLQAAAKLGVPYPILLYERFLGRTFAGHKDSVSELVGDVLEVRIEDALGNGGISYRKTKRAEKIPGFDQAPDFIIPDEFAPKVVI